MIMYQDSFYMIRLADTHTPIRRNSDPNFETCLKVLFVLLSVSHSIGLQSSTTKPRQIERSSFFLLDHNGKTRIYRLVSGSFDVPFWRKRDSPMGDRQVIGVKVHQIITIITNKQILIRLPKSSSHVENYNRLNHKPKLEQYQNRIHQDNFSLCTSPAFQSI